MALIDSFPEANPEAGDWLLIQRPNPLSYHKVAVNRLLTGSTGWMLKTSDYQASAGAKILGDTRLNSWQLALPPSPVSGDEVEVIALSRLPGLRINFSGRRHRGALSSNAKVIFFPNPNPECYERLIYLDDSTGWIDLNSRVGDFDDYFSLVSNLTRFAHYRMAHTDSGSVTDVTGANTGVGFGTFQLSQPSLLFADTNRSCIFGGTSSYIRCNSTAVAAPTAWTMELLFRSTIVNGGVIGFASNSLAVTGGSFDRELRFANGFLEGFTSPSGTIISPQRYNDGRTHIATYSGVSGGQHRLWVDGVLVASAAYSPSSYSGFWKLGYSTHRNTFFQGTMDEVFIAHSAANEADVLRRHQAALGIKII